MATRRELIEAVGERYGRSDRSGNRQIPDEFLKLTGYHRNHAIRVLCNEARATKASPGPPRPLYRRSACSVDYAVVSR